MRNFAILTLTLAASLFLVALAASADDPRPVDLPTEPRVAEPLQSDPFDPSAECVGANRLTNPSFEGNYTTYDPFPEIPDCPAGICQTAQMAAGWTPYWRSHNPADPEWMMNMPEYKPAERNVPGPVRVRTGDRAQQYFTFWRTHEAGIFQRVAATPGKNYCLSVWGHAWSSDDDDPWTSTDGFPLEMRLGIDPTGGTNWQSGSVIWSPFQQQYNAYGLFQMNATAQAGHITVFFYSKPQYPAKHNDVYWDDAVLAEEGGAQFIDPVDNLLFLAHAATPGPQSKSLHVGLTAPTSVLWYANPAPSGNLFLTLNPSSGRSGDNTTVTINSIGLSPGVYSRAVNVTTSPVVPGSPATANVTLVVANQYAFMPVFRRP